MGRYKAPTDDGFQRFEQFLEEWSRRDFMKRAGGAAALAAFMAGVPEFLAACGPGQQGQQGPTVSPVKGGHIVEGTNSDPTTFNSVFVQDTVSQIINGLTFDGLISADAQGNLIPMLATAVPKVESDQLTYTFNLRKDVKWSDGQQLTAEDVVFTYNLMFDPAYKPVRSRYRPDFEQYLESVKAPDPYTVIFKTKTVFAPFLPGYATYGIMPKHVVGKLSPDAINNADFNTGPSVVNGVFKFKSWQKGAQVVLERNESYYRGSALLDTFVLKTVSDTVAITNQLKTGELDVGVIDPSLLDSMATADNINRVSFASPAWEYIGFQTDPNNPAHRASGKILSDKTVRQALYSALNRQQIVDRVVFKQGVVGDSPISSVSWAYNADTKKKYAFDKKKAEDALDTAGYRKGPDGIRQKDGQKLSFELLTTVGAKTREAIAQVIKEQWTQIGVDLNVRLIQFTQYLTTAQTRDLDTYLGGISEGVDPDPSQIFHSRVIGKGLNRMGYNNPQLDKLLDDAAATLDRQKRKDMYNKVQDMLVEDAPIAVLYYPKANWGINRRVQRFGVGPYNRFGARPWMKDVFVTDGK